MQGQGYLIKKKLIFYFFILFFAGTSMTVIDIPAKKNFK
jgi:hypothetical protein